MKLRIVIYHPTELQPDSSLRLITAEHTFDIRDYRFHGAGLRALSMRDQNGACLETIQLREHDCWVYVMNDDGSNFDKRYYKAEAPEVIAARRAIAA